MTNSQRKTWLARVGCESGESVAWTLKLSGTAGVSLPEVVDQDGKVQEYGELAIEVINDPERAETLVIIHPMQGGDMTSLALAAAFSPDGQCKYAQTTLIEEIRSANELPQFIFDGVSYRDDSGQEFRDGGKQIEALKRFDSFLGLIEHGQLSPVDFAR